MSTDVAFVLGWPDEKVYAEGWIHPILMKTGIVKEMGYRVGHSALVLVNPSDRSLEYYDFGRYVTPPGKGRMRGAATDPDVLIPLKAKIDDQGRVANLEEIALFFSLNTQITHGGGTTFMSVCASFNYARAKIFLQRIQDRGSVRYGATGFGSLNCSRFVVQTLIAGVEALPKKLRLMFPESGRANSLGNVINAADGGKVWKIKDQEIETLFLNRFDAIVYTYRNAKIAFTGKRREAYRKVSQSGQYIAPEKPQSLQHQPVEWLGGLGAGMWLRLEQPEGLKKESYRVTRYEKDGQKIFDIVCRPASKDQAVDLNQPYHFTYDTNQLKASILQNGSVITLYFEGHYGDLRRVERTAPPVAAVHQAFLAEK